MTIARTARALALLAACGPRPLAWAVAAARGGRAEADPWSRLPGILARIRPPVFPARDFLLTAFGAVPDGETDASAAFRAAIDACHRAGGGRVVVPPGVFLTGPIHLKSRVNLHVSAGATIRFSRDPERYLPVVLTRWEGVELMGYSPLVYAFEQQDIAITGEGTLDGQAGPEHWWPWKLERTTRAARRPTATGSSARPRTACPSPSASTAAATRCARSSSSRTAARTC